MKKILKDNRGSITTVVTVTVLFFSVILSTAYMITSTNRKTQLKSELTARETYEKPLNNLDEIREEVTGLPTTDETQPYFPSNDFKRVKGTNLSNGFVIEDSDGNQYVWVEVPKSLYNNINYNSNNAKRPSSSTDYANIEYCLQQYTATYRIDGWSDTHEGDTANVGWLTSDEYTELKNSMLKSVYENGGFYVGRYEAGIGTNRTSKSATNSDGKYTIEGMPTPVTKADAYPYTYVTRTQAQNLASKVNAGTKTSSLMFGVQWDLVLAFMSKDTAKITSTSILTSNSTTIGNYRDNLWTIKNANAQYSTNYGSTFTACPNPFKKESSSGILLTTGADSSFSVQNIYDIAGNVVEWTLENTSSTDYPCARRGGVFDSAGSFSPAALRYDNYSTGFSNFRVGFRVSLF